MRDPFHRQIPIHFNEWKEGIVGSFQLSNGVMAAEKEANA